MIRTYFTYYGRSLVVYLDHSCDNAISGGNEFVNWLWWFVWWPVLEEVLLQSGEEILGRISASLVLELEILLLKKIWKYGPITTFLVTWYVGNRFIFTTQIPKFMGPTWGQPRSCRPEMGPMLAPWTLLLGKLHYCDVTWASWHLISPVCQQLAQTFIQANNKKLPTLCINGP